MKSFASRTRSRKRRAFSLVETAVAIAVSGILLYSFLLVFEAALALFRRVRNQEIQSLEVDPIKGIIQSHVRSSRFALYSSLDAAKKETKGSLVAKQISTSSSDFALRCTRRDGQGVFILHWSGSDNTLFLITGTEEGNNAGNAWNTPIPLTAALTYFEVDTGQGFCQVGIRIKAPLDFFSRAVVTEGVPQIGYTIIAESTT